MIFQIEAVSAEEELGVVMQRSGFVSGGDS